MPARALFALALALLLAGPSAAQQEASERALRDWGHSIGVLGYVYGAPLLELAIADYRQTQGLAKDMASLRAVAEFLAGTDAEIYASAPSLAAVG